MNVALLDVDPDTVEEMDSVLTSNALTERLLLPLPDEVVLTLAGLENEELNVPVRDDDGDVDAVTAAELDDERVLDADAVALKDNDILADELPLGVPLPDVDVLGGRVKLIDPDADRDILEVPLAVTELDCEVVILIEPKTETVNEVDGVQLNVTVALDIALLLTLADVDVLDDVVIVGDGLTVPLPEAEFVGDKDTLFELEPDRESVADIVPLAVDDTLACVLIELLNDTDTLAVKLAVEDAEDDTFGEPLTDTDIDDDTVALTELEMEPDVDRESLAVPDTVLD